MNLKYKIAKIDGFLVFLNRRQVAFKGKKLVAKNNGESGEARTRDNRLKRAVLYQLSYRPT
jgi:hypothetical protein